MEEKSGAYEKFSGLSSVVINLRVMMPVRAWNVIKRSAYQSVDFSRS